MKINKETAPMASGGRSRLKARNWEHLKGSDILAQQWLKSGVCLESEVELMLSLIISIFLYTEGH